MPNGDDLLVELAENVVDVSGGLRFTASGPHGTDRDDRLRGFDHGAFPPIIVKSAPIALTSAPSDMTCEYFTSL